MPEFEFASILVKDHVEAWGERHDVDAMALIEEHLLQLFGDRRFTITRANMEDDVLVVVVESPSLERARELGFTPDGTMYR